MSHYRSNLRDIRFDLFELLERSDVYGTGLFEDIAPDQAETILTEAERYATNKLARSFSDVGRDRVEFDPATNSVRLPENYHVDAADYLNSGWLDLELPQALSDQAVPPSLKWCVSELMLGANAAIPQGLNVIPQVVRLLHQEGNDQQRRLAEIITERKWMVTMILTEPDAGSDVGAGRTRAVPQADGTWHLNGIKRFITYGDHDLTENIIHLVLARPSGVDDVGGPGTGGLSLFVVPKFHFDAQTGELGERNGVFATGLEHKMGITGSPTCEMTFGGTNRPAVGFLLGDKHAGIQQMFEIIKHVRMLVGVKAMATLSTGYLNARAYAIDRVQGQSLTDPAARGPVSIIEHPDVRRSLMTQKAHVEGMRAMILYTATQQDRIELSRASGTIDPDADARHQLMLPIIKGFCSETAWRLLGQESLQVFGGSGYLKDYPLEQYVRDTKVDTLYEGTTGIQGLDLFSRKILRDNGAALERLLIEMDTTTEAAGEAFAVEHASLTAATAAVRDMVTLITEQWGGRGDKSTRALAAQSTTKLLLTLGNLVSGWLLLRSAEIADRSRQTSTGTDLDFYIGKIATGRWFARHILSTIPGELISVRNTSAELTELPHSAF
ncbi:acyl-CoA dehydrogenase [Rhodococcus sp. WS1]|uniref:acyl-CoA dehydrogenase n=1 Tax=unclassified Rhodococcus (in: high G+C Gram-positive bacteria) TaxID=192944 RepID=UPI001143E3C7|nr:MULTISPECIES: acyl-CoA dehydrogenase [unclassified Rhodococcus (in: high G+C Gram-positive bacteria)]ROZ52905.1 acyl-CoA dehydrogenase [Rhodococcus sp. WS1]TQC35996.1 acyl-CoA dehydrogenase [Rhodococcus sp. WS7]